MFIHRKGIMVKGNSPEKNAKRIGGTIQCTSHAALIVFVSHRMLWEISHHTLPVLLQTRKIADQGVQETFRDQRGHPVSTPQWIESVGMVDRIYASKSWASNQTIIVSTNFKPRCKIVWCQIWPLDQFEFTSIRVFHWHIGIGYADWKG